MFTGIHEETDEWHIRSAHARGLIALDGVEMVWSAHGERLAGLGLTFASGFTSWKGGDTCYAFWTRLKRSTSHLMQRWRPVGGAAGVGAATRLPFGADDFSFFR